jgi:hypothetical protein
MSVSYWRSYCDDQRHASDVVLVQQGMNNAAAAP